MFLIESMNNLLIDSQISDLIKINQYSIKYNLTLSKKDITEIINERNRVLKVYERIDFETEVIEKIINHFYDSPYILQENYTQIINEIIELFYIIKNETNDKLGDDELINLMENYFNNTCHGSLEFLRDLMFLFSNQFKGDETIER
ncbi:MAG: DUF6323 family protein [Clostridiales bacterium]